MGSISFFMLSLNLESPYKISIIYLGVIIIIQGLVSFYKHGGMLMTPTGVFMLVSVVLGGFTSIYMNYQEDYTIQLGHFISTYIIFNSQILIYYIFGNEKKSVIVNKKKNKRVSLRSETKTYAFKLGAFIIISSYIISLLHSRLSFFRANGIYIGIIILSVALFRSTNKGYAIKNYLFVASLFIVYYLYLFEGFGRINIATLAIAIILTFNYRDLTKKIKKIIFVGGIPSVLLASLMRGGTVNNLTGGIGSVVSPNYRFGQIVELYNNNVLNLRWGKTIWAAIVTPIPRVIWEAKPWNFNREITYIFAPQYVAYGHSEAAVTHAEWFLNFGYVGILLFIFLTGYLLIVLDSNYLRISKKRNDLWTKIDFVTYVAIIITTSGFLDLYWGGVSTFMARGGIRLLMLYGFVGLMSGYKLLKKW